MKLIENLGHPGSETINRLVGAAADGLKHAVCRISFGGAVDSLRVYLKLTRSPGYLPSQYSVVVDVNNDLAVRRVAFGETPKFGPLGTSLFAWRRRAAFLRWLGRADQGVAGPTNQNNFGHDGTNLEPAAEAPPFASVPFPLQAWGGVDGINFDVTPDPTATGLRQDYYGFTASPNLINFSDIDPADFIYGDWGVAFRDGFSVQAINGQWTDGWSFGPGNPGGVLWNAVHDDDGYICERYPFTFSSPSPMTGANVILVEGQRQAFISCAVQVVNLTDPDSGNPFFSMIPDNAVITSCLAQIKIESLAGFTEDFRFECDGGTVSPKPGFPVELETVPPISFMLLGGIRQGEGDRAGIVWEPLAIGDTGVEFVDAKWRVVDLTAVAQAWLTAIRRSRYHVFGFVPVIRGENPASVGDPVSFLKAMLLPDEFAIYESPARTTAGARGGTAYYQSPPVGDVDQVFQSRFVRAGFGFGNLLGSTCHVVWQMPEEWESQDVPRENWPPLVVPD